MSANIHVASACLDPPILAIYATSLYTILLFDLVSFIRLQNVFKKIIRHRIEKNMGAMMKIAKWL